MISLEYLCRRFSVCFQGRQIILYGTGSYAKALLCSCKNVEILGVADRDRTGECFEGRKVLSMKEALLLHPSAVVAAVELTGMKMIYDRMIAMCMAANAGLYYMTGVSLAELYGKIQDSDFHFLSLEGGKLRREILCHDVISFDIFDTLLVRKTTNEADVFAVVGERAKTEGIHAKDFQVFRQRALLENGVHNPDLYEIYFKLQELAGCSDQDCAQLCELEIDTEIRMLQPREKMVQFLRYAKECGKQVVLVSDMYLPAAVLERILHHFGIGGFDRIFVSCEYRQLKYEGLYQKVMEQTQGEKYLHIGDNSELDGAYAGVFGADFFLVKSPKEMLAKSSYSGLEGKAGNSNERMILGKLLNTVFNDPFCLYFTEGKPLVSSVYEVGYCFLAPLVVQYMIWLIREAGKESGSEIIFGARDGYLFQKLYETAKESDRVPVENPSCYFLTSRLACVSACTENDQDIEKVLDAPYDCLPEDVLADKFELDRTQLECAEPGMEDTVLQDGAGRRRADSWKKYKEAVFQEAAVRKKNYLKYAGKIGMKKGRKYLFFDLVSRGTSQYYLERLLGAELLGVYFWHSHRYASEELLHLNIRSCWDDSCAADQESYLFQHYLLLEAVFSSGDPSLKKMDENGCPVYLKEMRTAGEIRVMHQIQLAVQDYFTEFYRELWIPGQEIRREFADAVYSMIGHSHTEITDPDWNEMMLVDEWMNQKVPIDR